MANFCANNIKADSTPMSPSEFCKLYGISLAVQKLLSAIGVIIRLGPNDKRLMWDEQTHFAVFDEKREEICKLSEKWKHGYGNTEQIKNSLRNKFT